MTANSVSAESYCLAPWRKIENRVISTGFKSKSNAGIIPKHGPIVYKFIVLRWLALPSEEEPRHRLWHCRTPLILET
ncbi:hypothetical protein GCM10010909_25250 [Acidocella aquatica]|uniref:Uncharacterized protein n=1 Tax=Acidocella aquatica TaxID=1922313 RepID=A0ABQ6ACL9_9PROT|nr:hypothetical protein GCM10010909_25250 [Acidocella aquatica]